MNSFVNRVSLHKIEERDMRELSHIWPRANICKQLANNLLPLCVSVLDLRPEDAYSLKRVLPTFLDTLRRIAVIFRHDVP